MDRGFRFQVSGRVYLKPGTSIPTYAGIDTCSHLYSSVYNSAICGNRGIVTTMIINKLQSTKLWKETIHKLKLVAALTDSSMVAVADRLVDAELKRLGHDQSAQNQTKSDA